MKYKFNSTFPELGAIKEILKEFNLPKYPVATDDTVLYDGEYYIKDLYIYKYDAKNNWLRKFSNYYYNRPILNLTDNIIITTSTYGSDIHEYLGNYLRFQRDYKHFNLMSLYNCFSDRVIFPENYDENYNYYAIPVKFNQVYTIGFDSQTPITMYCTLWNGVKISGSDKDGSMLKPQYINKYNGDDIESINLNSLEYLTEMTVNNCKFTKPFIYTKLKNFVAKDERRNLLLHKDDLKLIIKIPVDNKTSITVLEGDYIFDNVIDGKVSTTMHFGEQIDKYHIKTYPTDLSLFKVNDEQKHPFADRLIEYLLDYAITNVDQIEENVKRTQDALLWLKEATPKILYGVWDENMNDTIYNIARNSYLDKYMTKRYIKSRTNLINDYSLLLLTSEGDSEGPIYTVVDSESNVYYKNLIDVKQDLLMYNDKDIEALFLAAFPDVAARGGM